MPGIIEFPTIVQQATQQFGGIFANEPERRHFAEYLTGLLVAEKKNVTGINAEFAQTTDQSCLNRWITEVEWDEVELNRQRLAWLQTEAQTRYAASGVIPIDNTLVGSIHQNYDMLLTRSLTITGETYLHIVHCLIDRLRLSSEVLP